MKLAQNKLSRRLKFRGLDVSIETDEGELRHWTDASTGEAGKTKMSVPYGYIRRTEGTDGDHVDVFVGPHEDAENVYVIHQRKAPDFKTFDEDKCMLGFHTADEAKAAYKNHYNDDRFFGSMSVLPFEKFKAKALGTFENPGKIAMPLPADIPSPLPSMGPLRAAGTSLRDAYHAAGARHALLAAGIPMAAMGLSASIGHKAVEGRPRPDTSPALRGMGGGAVGGAAGLGAGAGLAAILRRLAPMSSGAHTGLTAALGIGGLATGAYLGGRSARRAPGIEGALQQLGLKTSSAAQEIEHIRTTPGRSPVKDYATVRSLTKRMGRSAGRFGHGDVSGSAVKKLMQELLAGVPKIGMARPKTLSESMHEADTISRQLRSFARRTPDMLGTESSHNLASKTLDDLPTKAAHAAIYERRCKRAAEKLGWPWSKPALGTLGPQAQASQRGAAVAAGYSVPVDKNQEMRWPQTPVNVTKPQAPPAPAPAPAAMAQNQRMTAARAAGTNWDQAGR
jgi:hypothetical protein